jgi:CubicO group peptidase (beta-lactamase class C family)
MRLEKILFLVLLFLSLYVISYAQISSDNHLYREDSKLKNTQLSYSKPEAVGVDGQKLAERIDAIAREAILEQATPGAVVMIVKDNQVIFEKAYGFHTYENKIATKVDDIFDLASISKIAATTLAVMKLKEEGKINLNETIGYYLKDAKNTNKANIRLKEVMLHEGGLIPFIPFYRDLTSKDHRSDSTAAFPTKVAEGFYLRKDYFEEVMWPKMLNSPVRSREYVYSDLSMYIMQKVVEEQSNTSLDQYVKEQFYDKLGMNSTGFNAWKNFPVHRVIPTERDGKSFRDTLLVGYVHDQGAAMASGVAGHAGLFSTAQDLAIYGQLLLNRGSYGGTTLFKPETVDLFTSQQSANSRRGLGFDRYDPDKTKEYPSRLATPSTYGHTGYTGTCLWIDPNNQLIYIFLSNRVHPKVSSKLSSLSIRSRIMDVIYESIDEGLPEN